MVFGDVFSIVRRYELLKRVEKEEKKRGIELNGDVKNREGLLIYIYRLL